MCLLFYTVYTRTSRFLRVSCRLFLELVVSRVLLSKVLYVSYRVCLMSCVSRVICVSCPLCFLSFVSRGFSLSVSCVSLSCMSRVHIFLYLVSLRFVCLVSNIPGIQYVLRPLDVSRVSTPGVSVGFWVFSVTFSSMISGSFVSQRFVVSLCLKCVSCVSLVLQACTGIVLCLHEELLTLNFEITLKKCVWLIFNGGF